MKLENFNVVFIIEGFIEIKMPSLSVLDALFSNPREIDRQADFFARPIHEVLLRTIVFELFEQRYLKKDESIIDIGCWLGDNAIVWAKLLDSRAVVHAIDPSPNNIGFASRIAELNGIKNINFVTAACHDRSGVKLNVIGSLDHGQFLDETNDHRNFVVSSTLDDIISASEFERISLIHVDVEGSERRVLEGASEIIQRCKPVIIFEQHISKEKVSDIADSLKDCGYQVYMINEVLPGCDLDCRNFIAFHQNRDAPVLKNLDNTLGRQSYIWYASLQGTLILV